MPLTISGRYILDYVLLLALMCDCIYVYVDYTLYVCCVHEHTDELISISHSCGIC